MNYLLDTHVLLWMLDDKDKLSKEAESAITDRSNTLYVSTATFWELAVKKSSNKLTLDRSLLSIMDTLAELDIRILPIKAIHVFPIETLKTYHRDPFDRIIIAQAMVEELTVISKDAAFPFYPISVLWD
ncbi:type II toxin-antitoxin system VapC family toxin [Larkinella knui]|uniref:Type II toxin-antitoxin system VapC family toxin n=1 Tax=Larkinella knui TaxID=2025310 RepID=A0A3P1CAB4_9BACT|nr:type II toxin-antitoxin system VapC family toxin [Larkinella knui]RRB10258.1 type II toxin-antitoxin system VapC family toxin [Larkinella knui]